MTERNTGKISGLYARFKKIFHHQQLLDMDKQSLDIEKQFLDIETFAHPAIREMGQHLVRVLDQIIVNGKHYDMVIGDDTSGRLPSLIIGKVLNNLNLQAGIDPIPIRFIGRSIMNRNRAGIELENILNRSVKKPSRVLVVTEYMDSGGTVKNLSGCLVGNGILFDVASLVVSSGEKTYRLSDTFPDSTQLYAGIICGMVPLIHSSVGLTGLRKNAPFDERVDRLDGASVRKVRTARQDILALATRFTDHYGQRVVE